MPYSLKIQPQVFAELQEASEFYNKQQPGLGNRFIRTIDKEFKNLQKFPWFQIRYKTIRCKPVKKFP
ncbi:hypothetical protein DDZ16_05810 [Marinilabilia rubra]|uniref:Type II toxin-antitoxin system RelE/ParE family toxin n=1 Tax=Marinilabilia rubra TaxID=2162893 RepID=A0A2U2BBJ0_9BACT|nr:hypothetical protein DDZ16_05810 [Marinilabilia rubra]